MTEREEPSTAIPDVIVVRTNPEVIERLLRQELAGHREYAAGVRYRLVPYVW